MVALLVSSNSQRAVLAEVLAGLGYLVVFARPPQEVLPEQLAAVAADAWLLDLADASPLVDWLLEHSPAPLLFGVGNIPAAGDEELLRWQRRLQNKLAALLGPLPQTPVLRAVSAPQTRPCVWLLAASLGGPAAVKQFLDALPADLPVAFVYAQHIDAGFEQQLPRILGRHNTWKVRNYAEGLRLQHGEVLVAPIAHALQFGAGGQVMRLSVPWPGVYQPAFEALLDELSGAYSPDCGAIIFSGMGEDGVAACGRMRQQGMQVWTQSAQSAACATMPEAVQQAGYSSRDGSPEELAAALQEWLEQEGSLGH